MSKASVTARRKKKLLLLVIEIVILAMLSGGIFMFSKVNKINITSFDSSALQHNNLSNDTLQTYSGYTTIAFFGLDNRKQGSLSTGNSDVIMVASIDNDTQTMKIVSVYRDTYLNVGDQEISFNKCNSAYAYGGYKRAISMLNKNLDLNIDNYVTFDFQAVADAIDILGGVDITIESDEELMYLNKYITNTNGILNTHAKTISSTGKHTLNGVQAVAYSRIRYTAGGDYRRAQRQRVVLKQMISKAKHASASKLLKLVNKVFPQIETGLSQKEMYSMLRVMLNYDSSNSRGFPFYRTTETLAYKGSVVVPCDLEKNVIKLQRYLYGTKNYKPSETVKSYSQEIISETGMTADSATHDDFDKSDS